MVRPHGLRMALCGNLVPRGTVVASLDLPHGGQQTSVPSLNFASGQHVERLTSDCRGVSVSMFGSTLDVLLVVLAQGLAFIWFQPCLMQDCAPV